MTTKELLEQGWQHIGSSMYRKEEGEVLQYKSLDEITGELS
jgi:hypothetical protein